MSITIAKRIPAFAAYDPTARGRRYNRRRDRSPTIGEKGRPRSCDRNYNRRLRLRVLFSRLGTPHISEVRRHGQRSPVIQTGERPRGRGHSAAIPRTGPTGGDAVWRTDAAAVYS
jgi:hypothetical protein